MLEVNFSADVKVASVRTCADTTADTNIHNFENTKNVQGFLHIFVDKGLFACIDYSSQLGPKV